MEEDVEGARLRRAADRVRVRLAGRGRCEVGRHADRVDPEHVLRVPVARAQLHAEQCREAVVARRGGVRDPPVPARLEVVGEDEEVVARGAVRRDDLGRRRDAVRAVGVRVQVAAEPGAGRGEGGRVHALPLPRADMKRRCGGSCPARRVPGQVRDREPLLPVLRIVVPRRIATTVVDARCRAAGQPSHSTSGRRADGRRAPAANGTSVIRPSEVRIDDPVRPPSPA